MHPSPATIAALLLVLAAACLIALTAVAVRPSPQAPAISTHAAPVTKPRGHERDPAARRTQRRGAGRRIARPAARFTPAAAAPQEAAVTPASAPAPETVVKAYYRALDARRFDAAWAILTPAVRAAFGHFERWSDGYAKTLSSAPRDIEVARDGAVATVAHELVTADRSACGPLRRRFAVHWRLVLAGEGWRAVSLSAVKRAGPEPAEACPARHDAARVAGGR